MINISSSSVLLFTTQPLYHVKVCFNPNTPIHSCQAQVTGLLFTAFSVTRFAMHRIYAIRINSRGMSRVFCDLRSQKTPRGILPVNSNLIFTLLCTRYYPTKCAVTFHKGIFSLPIYRNCTHILRNQHLTSAVFQALQRIRRGMTICVCRRTGNNG